MSHCRRSNNNGKLYLGCDTTITACYEHYLCKEMTYDPVSSDKYRRIFTEDYNIGVKSPKTDTCKTCDVFKVKIDGTEDQQVKKRLEHERELHQRKAEAGQADISIQTKRAEADSNYHIITFDLQQTLPVPNAECSFAAE